MGSCNSKDTIYLNDSFNRQSQKREQTACNLAKKQDLEDKFKDMPAWEGDRWRGVGIKRMKGYKCTLNIDLLNKLRENFWTARMKEKLTWRSLKQACQLDDVRANNLIKQLGLIPYNNCLNHLVDQNNFNYFIPNFCINDPYFEKLIKPSDQLLIIDTSISIFINDLYENKKTQLLISLNSTGKDLKNLYFSSNNIKIEDYTVRLLFGGAEILDQHFLFQHALQNEYHVLLLKNLCAFIEDK